MTIEIAPPSASALKANARPEAHGVKAKSTSADASGDTGATGFGAILGALGDAATDAATSGAVATDVAQADAAAVAATPMDASALLLQNPQIGLQAARAAATAAAATSKDATGAAGSTVALDTKLNQAATQAGDAAGAARKALPGAAADTGAATQAAIAASDAAQQSTESLTQTLQHAGSHAKAAKELAQGAADTTQSGSSATASTQASEAKDSKLLVALEQGRAQQAAKAPEPVFAPLLAKAEKPLSERVGPSGKSAEPGYSGTALGVSAPDYSQSGALAPALTPDMQVAEQVTYWVTQNVQNAEMKLDGLGASPVEVSIHVQGNEAQISFRSDEAATRSVLEGATAHLKDMLQREGMVLTGVSVGTSGSGDSSGSQRQARQSARQGLIAPLKVATVEAGRRMNTAAGSAVDLFV